MKGLPKSVMKLIRKEIDAELARTAPHQKLNVDIEYRDGKIELAFTRTDKEGDENE
jgi:hypothetical protein